MNRNIPNILWAGVLVAVLGCSPSNENATGALFDEKASPAARSPQPQLLEIGDETVTVRPQPNPERNAYFGDLHVHTAYSMDAFAFGTIATPYDAYLYALN